MKISKRMILLLPDLLQNNTIEERVALLEVQMSEVREDLATTDENVEDLDQDVNFLFDEQVIQDERLFSLEQTANDVDDNLDLINEELEGKFPTWNNRIRNGNLQYYPYFDIVALQDTTLALDFRVTVLEKNGGGGGNSSVAELEVRVETLEGTADDHETRISAIESDVNGKNTFILSFIVQ